MDNNKLEKYIGNLRKYVRRKRRIPWITTSLTVIFLIGIGIFFFMQNHVAVAWLCVAYCIGAIINFFVIQWLARRRSVLIAEFESAIFDDFLLEVLKTYSALAVDVLLNAIWVKVRGSAAAFNQYTAEEYKDNESLDGRYYMMVSMLKSFTYMYGGRAYRITKILYNDEAVKSLLKEYARLLENQKNSHLPKTGLFNELSRIESLHKKEKEEASGNPSSTTSYANILEQFVVMANDEPLLRILKIVMVVMAAIIMLLQSLAFNVNELATDFFEILTVILLLVDVSKDKDFDYLH